MRPRLLSACALVITLLPFSQAASAGPTCGLPAADQAAWWAADVDASDRLGCHDGTLKSGAAFALGRAGLAFSLDGVDDCVEIPDADLWALGTSNFGLDLWANFGSQKTDVAFVATSEGGGPQAKWGFIYQDGGYLSFHINQAGWSSGVFLVHAPFSPAVGTWYHLAVTRTNDLFRILVNGNEVGSQTYSGSVPDVHAPLTIGQIEGIAYFPGLIDEVHLVRL
jgi:hypothetical protein